MMSDYHPFVAPRDTLNHHTLPCKMYAEQLGQQQGCYQFGPRRNAGSSEEQDVAWVRREHTFLAFRYISDPSQSQDRACIGGGTIGEAQAAAARYAHTGDFVVIEESWDDVPISRDEAMNQIAEWLAEADRATEVAREAWERLPIADVAAAEREVEKFVARLRLAGIDILQPPISSSPAKYDAARHLNWLRQRRDAWRGVLRLIEQGTQNQSSLLWRALQIWCDPAYPIDALCQDVLCAGKVAIATEST